MSDGLSWYYSLPEKHLKGYAVYKYQGKYRIGKLQTHLTRQEYAKNGEGIYETIKDAKKGIIASYEMALSCAKDEVTRAERALNTVKNELNGKEKP